VYEFIYAFHMPLFFITAGALGIKSIRTNPARAFWSRVGSLAWPYLFWGFLFIMLQPVAARFMLYPPSNTGLYHGIIRLLAGDGSWFLWTLFFAHCILLICSKIPLYLLVAISAGIASIVPAGSSAPYALIHLFPFMALGAAGCDWLLNFRPSNPARSVAWGCIPFAALGLFVEYDLMRWPGMYLVAGTIGSLGSFAVVQAFGHTWFGLVLAKIGKASLVVFLLHPYFQGATRELIAYFAGHAPVWQLSGPTLGGVLGPTIIWFAAEKAGLEWLFRLKLDKSLTRDPVATLDPRP
jgi:fucose 4-O-acetylase-like acetyltransferase